MDIEDWKIKDIKAECQRHNKCTHECQLFNQDTEMCKLDEVFKYDEAPYMWELERGNSDRSL